MTINPDAMEVDPSPAGEAKIPSNDKASSDDEFGDDFEYNEELESILHAAETGAALPAGDNANTEVAAEDPPIQPEPEPMVIEEVIPLLSPFERFRRHGYLSVSDLVGTVWCEVQYDYRLRTLPYLPPSRRPAVITSDKGKEIVVNKVKEEGRERIVKRGQTIHKRLEREIHPEEVVVTTESREDVWGLRFMNMLAALEALITLGTCREVPVVGFVGGILVTGIIDELQRHPLNKAAEKTKTRSSRQTALTSFFSPTKSRPVKLVKTHKIYVSDSKTRARDSLPKEADTMAGQLQCMMYKELLDAMLLSGPQGEEEEQEVGLRPSARPLAFSAVFQHLGLDPEAPFSDHFMSQTRMIVRGNDLRLGTGKARNLQDMVRAWERYVIELGLGSPDSRDGRTESRLELVYRRAGPKNAKSSGTGRRKGKVSKPESGDEASKEEDRLLQLAIAESLKPPSGTESHVAQPPPIPEPSVELVPQGHVQSQHSEYHVDRTSDEEREEDELALAVEMSLATAQDDAPGEVSVTLSQRSDGEKVETRSSSPTPPPGNGTASGSIIGRHRFQHDTELLEKHLTSVLQYWRGEREPVGVDVVDTGRCAWCEFEEGCEWRAKKAEEDWQRSRTKSARQ